MRVWTVRMPRERRRTWRAAWPCWIGLVRGTHRGVYVRIGDRAVFLTVRMVSL